MLFFFQSPFSAFTVNRQISNAILVTGADFYVLLKILQRIGNDCI